MVVVSPLGRTIIVTGITIGEEFEVEEELGWLAGGWPVNSPSSDPRPSDPELDEPELEDPRPRPLNRSEGEADVSVVACLVAMVVLAYTGRLISRGK
jgi:hypothetical protein